ncbi:MAG TPA: I78 family peptidase inhibitor [Sphingomicrobium sp.]|jgi:hypothetical protein|nr:I78 family peptidase inhibitor [Sphingomicrobium sp.]
MTVRVAIAAAAGVAMSACSTQAAPPPDSTPPQRDAPSGHSCDSTNIQQFVGQERSPELESEMLRVSGAATVRWVPPGTAVTMEYRSDRLTVYLESSNRVERISCS